MKLIIIVLIIFLLNFVLVAEAVPIWSQDSSSVPSNSQYWPGRNYGFQIKWDDPSGISTVLFEWNNNNYTASNSGDIFYYNLTDLSTGTYSYKWYASNTVGESASSDQWDYVINKNNSYSMSLLLNGVEGDKSYSFNEKANFTVLLEIPNKIVYLDSTYPDWILQTGTSVLYNETRLRASPDLFSLIAYWDGDENYSSKSITYKFDNGAPQYVNIVAHPKSGVGYDRYKIYQFSITWKDATLKKVLFRSNHTRRYRTYKPTNLSGIFSIELEDLPAMNFIYEWVAEDTLKLKNSTGEIPYEIKKRKPLTLDISPSLTVQEDTTVFVKCFSSSEEVDIDNFKLYRNSELIKNITNTTVLIREEWRRLEPGIYKYVCNSTETQNFTAQSESLTLVVKPIVSEMLKIMDVHFPALIIGESTEASFTILNNYSEYLSDIIVSLSGIPSDWYSIEDFQKTLSNKSSQKIKINFNTPSNAEAKYNILIIVEGKTVSGVKIATESIETLVYSSYKPSEPRKNKPPEYSESIYNVMSGGTAIFSLKVKDDLELSGYIFSTNITGVWKNDSLVLLSGTEDRVYTEKTVNLPPDSVVAWKVYANDTDNEWAVSEEYFLKTKEWRTDFIIPFIIAAIGLTIAIIILIIGEMKSVKKV